MKPELPQDRFINIDGIRTRYWAAGDTGSTVVLIHGLGGFIENWMYNITPLAEKHHVYALDLLGFGQTDNKPLVRDLNTLVGFIHSFMKAQKISGTSLIGNSLGGGLALQFTLEYPEIVEKLILVDNAGMGREVCTDFRFCALPVLNAFFAGRGRKSANRILPQLVYDVATLTPEFRELSYKYGNVEGAMKALLSTLRAGLNLLGQKGSLTRLLGGRLGTIKAPTLVVWGKQDHIIPVAHARIAADKIPGARLEIFDRCGHMPMFEHPDKFNRLVLDFMAEEKIPREPLKKALA